MKIKKLIVENLIVAFDLFNIIDKICIHTTIETIMYYKY